MKKLKTLFLVTFLLSLCALCFASCRTTKNPPSLPQISAPTNLHREENFLVWNGAEGATGYVVDVNGATYELSDTRFDLTAIVEPDSYMIMIQAKGDGVNFADSTWATVAYNYATNFVFAEIDDGAAYEITGTKSKPAANISLPNQYHGKPVVSVGKGAFQGIESLNSVTIPEGIVYIQSSSFQGCKNLANVRLPSSLKTIGEASFKECTALTEISLPEGLETIEKEAFGQSSLQHVTLPDSLTKLGNYAFSDSSLQSINIPLGITEIPTACFKKCSSLTRVDFDGNVTTIGNSAFLDCSALSRITIPESVTSILTGAFQNCISLQSVVIPKGVTELNSTCFYGCTALESVVISEGVTKIKNHCFQGCTALQSIVIPESVTSILNGVFQDCTALQSVRLPQKLTAIASDCFNGCTSLTKINLPGNLTDIYDNAFKDCVALTSFNVPESVTFIYAAFENCGWYNALPDGEVYLNRVFYRYKGAIPENTELTIREGTVSVSPNACYDTSKGAVNTSYNIVKIVLPSTIKEIGSFAFFDNRITELILPQGIERLSEKCLGSDSKTIGPEEVTIPKSVTYFWGDFIPYAVQRVYVEDQLGWHQRFPYAPTRPEIDCGEKFFSDPKLSRLSMDAWLITGIDDPVYPLFYK